MPNNYFLVIQVLMLKQSSCQWCAYDVVFVSGFVARFRTHRKVVQGQCVLREATLDLGRNSRGYVRPHSSVGLVLGGWVWFVDDWREAEG